MRRARALLACEEMFVLGGDYNVIPTDIDVYKPERWLDDALFAPEVRAAFFRLLDQGWTDALRKLHPNEKIYTFWDYFRNAFGRVRRRIGDADVRTLPANQPEATAFDAQPGARGPGPWLDPALLPAQDLAGDRARRPGSSPWMSCTRA